MKVTLDGTPLLGARTGIGTYTDALLRTLAPTYPDDEFSATAFTLRGRDSLPQLLPPGVAARARGFPARALHAAWRHSNFPPVEAVCGATDVFHATNFVLGPLMNSGGVLTVHDLAYLRYPDTVATASLAYQELVPAGLRRAAAVCVVSQAIADQLLDAYRFPAERVIVTPLGVDEQWFSTTGLSDDRRGALGLPSQYVVAVGTLEPRKNLRALIEVWRAHTQLPPLALVGGAGWGADLDTSGIATGRVILTGRVPYADLRAVVAGAELLVFPSLDEGFGLPPLEALATGTPVVASDIAVTREVLGGAASYADPRDIEAWGEAISASLDSPAGTAASRRAHAAGFTWRQCAERTYAAYQLAAD